jgi:serine/threonine-protein kinase
MAVQQPPLGGRYLLVEPIGVGGMSVVWRGYDEVLERPVAVKLLSAEQASDVGLRRRIRREAQAAARLCHPHLANIYDYGESAGPESATADDCGGLPYVVMELVDGEPMSTRLAAVGTLPWRTAVTICAEVASALSEAHAHGVVHRDVKPGNILLTPAGAKLVDFGISALVGESDFGLDQHLLGTPAYVAPERLDGWHANTASDVYALGLVLYRALSGGFPWNVDTTTQMLEAHRTEEPAPLPELTGLPSEVSSLCDACLAKEPGDRPSSREVAQALGKAAGVVVPLPSLAAFLGSIPASSSLGSEMVDLPSLDHRLIGSSAAHISATTVATPTGHEPTLLDAASAVGAIASVPAYAPFGWRKHRLRALVAGWVPSVPMTRTALAFLTVGALVVSATVAWNLTGTTDDTGTSAGQGEEGGYQGGEAVDSVAAAPRLCRVRYEVRREWRTGFDASVTVTNTGVSVIDDATLRFAFPGDQTIARDLEADDQWVQSGREVTTVVGGPGGSLAPGSSARIHLTAVYGSENPLPTLFFVADTACHARVSGPVANITEPVAEEDEGKKKRKHDDDDDDDSGPGGGGGNSGPGGGGGGGGDD